MSDNRWHINPAIPVTVVLAVVIQFAGGFMWVGMAGQKITDLDNKVQNTANLEREIAVVKNDVKHIREDQARISADMSTLLKEIMDSK